jgi:hypothetical protein
MVKCGSLESTTCVLVFRAIRLLPQAARRSDPDQRVNLQVLPDRRLLFVGGLIRSFRQTTLHGIAAAQAQCEATCKNSAHTGLIEVR